MVSGALTGLSITSIAEFVQRFSNISWVSMFPDMFAELVTCGMGFVDGAAEIYGKHAFGSQYNAQLVQSYPLSEQHMIHLTFFLFIAAYGYIRANDRCTECIVCKADMVYNVYNVCIVTYNRYNACIAQCAQIAYTCIHCVHFVQCKHCI